MECTEGWKGDRKSRPGASKGKDEEHLCQLRRSFVVPPCLNLEWKWLLQLGGWEEHEARPAVAVKGGQPQSPGSCSQNKGRKGQIQRWLLHK